MEIWGLILAAGAGSRLPNQGCSKQFLEFEGAPLYFSSARNMASVARLSGLVFTFPPNQLSECEAGLESLISRHNLGIPCFAVSGGARRQDSVNSGLAALPETCTHVLVHDGARPFASPALINKICDALSEGAAAVIPGIEVVDTIKEARVGDGCTEYVSTTLERSSLRAVQTPQGFELRALRLAHQKAAKDGLEVTDDAALLEYLEIPVRIVEGEMENIKITNPSDLASLERCAVPQTLLIPCNGFGYDVHKYGQGRPMKLGGVPINGAPEVIAHSDGDVLLHALTDALLGCLGQGDIGELFPDSDAAFDNIDSGILLSEVLDRIRMAEIIVTHVDLTLIAQIPRLSPWKDAIKKNVASLMHLPSESVGVKATTEEGLGFTGQKKGIKAVALVSAYKACKGKAF